jgi:gliding motility-associated-like protein
MQVQPDICLSGKGSIKGIVVKDMNGTGNYTWYNSFNDSIGNSLNIQNLSAGTYYLKARDLFDCSVTSRPVSITNRNDALPNPKCDDQTILKNTSTTLQVKDIQQGIYQWFDDASGTKLLQQNNTGTFATPTLSSDQTYYLRLVQGVCSSELVPIKITLVDKTGIYVPNAFTPNGDSKNDLLKVIAYGKVTLKTFTIYNRWGQIIFSTTNINKGWNGTLNGNALEAGVYIWFVKAIDDLKQKTIEQKGTVVLIR